MTLEIRIYYITGRQLGPISIPHSWCEECDLTVRLVNRLVEELDAGDAIRVEAKPWLANMIPALLKGGWHPPVVLVGGQIHSQGVVPDPDILRGSIFSYVKAGLAYLANSLTCTKSSTERKNAHEIFHQSSSHD